MAAGSKFILSVVDLVADPCDAQDHSRGVVSDDPIPERWTEIESVVQVLGADQHVDVEQIRHQTSTPSRRPSSRNVAIFLKPSIRNASVKEDRPSRVATITALANRGLTRAPVAW